MKHPNTTPTCDKKNARKGTTVCESSNIERKEKVTQFVTPTKFKSLSETASDKQDTSKN